MTSRLRRFARRLKSNGVTSLVLLAFRAVDWLSLERALLLGEHTGALLYRVLRKPRRVALEHLQIAFGDSLTPTAREHLARASFINVALSFCEVAKIEEIHRRHAQYFELEGWEHAQTILADGKGAVVVTGHIGNWELLGPYFAWLGLPVAAMARRVYAERVNELLVNLRRRQGVETILAEGPHSMQQIHTALTQNALLTMVIDQDAYGAAASVPLFGRLARTPAAAASLAIRNGLPVVAVFIQRRGGSGHRITISPPFTIERSADPNADIAMLSRQLILTIEAQIRRNPAEWVWWRSSGRYRPLPHLELDRDFQYTSVDAVARGRG